MRRLFPPRLALAFWASLALVSPGRAQEEKVRTIPFEGPEFFCHILHNEGVRPIDTLEKAFDNPEANLIIVFGDPNFPHNAPFLEGKLKKFVEAGGNLLVATDYRLKLADFRVQFDDAKVKQVKEQAYGHIECPKMPLPGPGFARDHPLFLFLRNGIATNRPGFLHPSENKSLEPLLAFPEGVSVSIPARAKVKAIGFFENFQRRPPRPIYMLGSGKTAPPAGRVLFIAGHGMFINGVMAQKDIDNFDFSVNAVRWLSERPGTRSRREALLVIDGQIVTDFDMKLTPPLPPIPMPTVKMLNRLVRGLEDERFFHKAMQGLFFNSLERIMGIVLAAASFGILLYGTKKLMEGRAQVETAVPSMVGPAPTTNPTAPIEERSQARLRKANFAAEAKQLALDWLHAEFDVTPDRWRPDVKAEFVVQGFFWPPAKLRRQASEVLALARAGAAGVSRHEFFVLVEALRDLSQALKEGRLALLVEGKNVRQA